MTPYEAAAELALVATELRSCCDAIDEAEYDRIRAAEDARAQAIVDAERDAETRAEHKFWLMRSKRYAEASLFGGDAA